jgi:uncharacterized protein YcfL
MKKILLLMLSLLILVGCSNQQVSNQTSKEIKKELSIDNIIQAIKDNGYTVGEKESMFAQMIGADEGYKFAVDDKQIEVYRYDIKTPDEKKQESIKEIKNTGYVTVQGLDTKIKITLIKNYGIVFTEETPNQNEIIKIINNLK